MNPVQPFAMYIPQGGNTFMFLKESEVAELIKNAQNENKTDEEDYAQKNNTIEYFFNLASAGISLEERIFYLRHTFLSP